MICLALSPERIRQLDLPMMGLENTEAMRTAFEQFRDARNLGLLKDPGAYSDAFQHLGGMPVGLAIYSIVFGAAHFTQGYDVAIATGLLGLFWGWLYMKRRSVVAAMVSLGFVERDTRTIVRQAARMIHPDSPYRKCLDMIVAMADALGMSTIAEGVPLGALKPYHWLPS